MPGVRPPAPLGRHPLTTRAAMTPRFDRFPDDLVSVARFSRAIGHPARLELIKMLAEAGSAPLNDLARPIPLAPATVTQHVVSLEKYGLVHAGRGRGEFVLDAHALRTNGDALAAYLHGLRTGTPL